MADGVIGIFGGTFDPPHYGHLAAAQEAWSVAGLEQVLFVPTHQNPLKLARPTSAPEHRLAMTELAVRDNDRFVVSNADLRHPGPSYTVDLLGRLRAELGGAELAFIVGMDVLHELHRWRQPRRLLELARLVAISRPGRTRVDPRDLEPRLPGAAARITVVETPGVAISGTELRARFAGGLPVRYLLPDSVIEYVATHGLYRGARSQ